MCCSCWCAGGCGGDFPLPDGLAQVDESNEGGGGGGVSMGDRPEEVGRGSERGGRLEPFEKNEGASQLAEDWSSSTETQEPAPPRDKAPPPSPSSQTATQAWTRAWTSPATCLGAWGGESGGNG